MATTTTLPRLILANEFASTARGLLFAAVLFIVSPLSLYASRLTAAVVVGFLACWAAFFLIVPGFSVSKAPTVLDVSCFLFVAYMSANCVLALLAGNGANNALADLLPVVEVYGFFQIAKRISFPESIVGGWLRWILWFTAVRAAWQLFALVAGLHIAPPIYAAGVPLPIAAIGGFIYDRPIDPICGIMFSISAVLYLIHVHRPLALFTAVLTGAVLLLGMTRSEWLAAIAAIFVGMYCAGRLRKAFLAFSVLGLVLAAIFVVFPSLYMALGNRVITKTVEQLTSESDIGVQGLRIIEISGAIEKFRAAPIFGHRLGSWFGTNVMSDDQYVFVQLHNSYLNLLANAGLCGALLLTAVIVRVKKFVMLSLHSGKAVVLAVLPCAVASLAWYGVFMAFQPIYSAYHLTGLIGLLFGISATASRQFAVRAANNRNALVVVSAALVDRPI